MGFAGGSASLFSKKKTFAGMLQVPQKTFWTLQEYCKRHKKLFGLCRNAASATKNFLDFAGMLQTPRKTFWTLQECCKCHKKLFGLCRNAANATKNFLDFAGTLQTPQKTFWPLQGRCKDFRKTKDRDMTSRPPTRRMRGGVTRHKRKNVRSDGGVSGLN